MSRSLLILAVCVTLFAATGATCPRVVQQYTAPAPVAFGHAPSMEEVVKVVNENSGKIKQLQTSGATLSIPGVPALRVNFSCERPQRVRLIADTSLTGVELDMGSNDAGFWMWVKRNDPPAVYYCRHDQFHGSAVRQVIPIEPSWLMEAIGVVTLDPAGNHEGPTPLEGGKLGVRTKIRSGDSEVTKLTILDATHGWILEQHVFDPAGKRLATALASKHRYDAATGVSLPRHVEVQLPTIEMGFSIDVHDYIVNHLDGDPEMLWVMPERRDAPLVDLGRMQGPPQVSSGYQSNYGSNANYGGSANYGGNANYGPVPVPVRPPANPYRPETGNASGYAPPVQQIPSPVGNSGGPTYLPRTESRSNYEPSRYHRLP